MGEVVKSSESWAKSIPAENVQALANETSMNPDMEIPLRYIRPDLDHHQDNINSIIDEMVPIIDMKRLLDPNLSSQESSKLHHACMEWGFFQVVNHGVDDEVIEKMKVDLEEFFKLPLKEKEVFAPLPGGLQGYGQKLVLNEEKLEWQDMMFLITQPVLARNFRFWPTSPPTFRCTLDKYSEELKSVSMSLFAAIAKNLGLNPQVLHDVFKEQQRMRMNYYPPCPKANQVLGINPHTDAGALTILLQVSDNVQGLQIKRNDQWLPVQPLPHALVVNIGDALEIVTNGKYASVEHRVMVNNKKERLSIAAYHSPSFDKIIGPLPEIVQGGKEYYKTMKYEEYMEFHFLAKVEGKNHMDFMKLNN